MREFERQIKRVVNKANYWKERDIKILCSHSNKIKLEQQETMILKSIVMGLDYIEILGKGQNKKFNGLLMEFNEIQKIKAYNDRYNIELKDGNQIEIEREI